MKHSTIGRRHTLPLTLLSAVLAVPVVIVGCGGGNDGPSTTAGTTTAGTTTAGTTTAGTTTAGGTTATTTAGGTTAGTTTGPTACTNEPANLMFSSPNAYNGSAVNTTCGSGFATRLPGSSTGITAVTSLFEDIGPTGRAERRFTVLIDTPTPIANGTRYNLNAIPAGTTVRVQYLERANGTNTFRAWQANGGTLTVQNLAGPVTFNLSGGTFGPSSGGAAGFFTLNGTVDFNKQF